MEALLTMFWAAVSCVALAGVFVIIVGVLEWLEGIWELVRGR